MKNTLLSRSALSSGFVLAALSVASPAWAQATDVSGTGQPTCSPDSNDPNCRPVDAQGAPSPEGNITVTGSRIRRPNIESQVPVTSVGGEEFFQQGQNNIGDTLNDLPQLRSTFAQQNPGAGVGIAGLNLLDLRGLGTVRTLVLVNGRRHVPADILNNASSPDVNTIPNDLIERVDIVTGGNSAVYGSDAIAGVVNFVLRRDFDGVQIRGTAAVSQEGYGGNQYASILAGHNFAGGRGNVTLHAEYANQERIFASEIPFLRQNNGFATVDADTGIPGSNSSDGFPDAVFVRDIRSATIHRYGIALVPQPQTGVGGTPQCGVGTLANNGPANTNGTSFNCGFIFTPEGRLTPLTGSRFGTGPAGTIIGGNGQTSREADQLSVLPAGERYNFNLLAHYEFSPALELFLEAKYSRINTVGNAAGPTFLNNSTASLGNDARIDPRLDNPFLNPADRTIIANAYLANTCTFALGTATSTAGCVNQAPGQAGATAAQEAARAAALAARNAAIANGSFRFLFGRNLTDLGPRDEYFQRDTFRVVGGLRGTFNTDWNYELSVNYGKFEEEDNLQGYVNRQRFLLSLDAGRNPATGQIQCRSQFDPAARVGLPAYVNSAADLAADIAACVPYNPFGAADNRAAVAYFNQPIRNTSSIDQLDIMGFVGGDSSQLFELPGGPVRFVLGGEYRREHAFNDSDAAADTGISNAVFLGDVDAPALEVKEAFAEIQIPILRDVPFFRELTISGAGRISDYNNAVGTVKTYNAGVEWAPVDGLRFRANYGRAIRAPNVTESGFPNVPNFANGFIDPCNANNIGANAIREGNCRSQLTAAQLANLQAGGFSLGIISGSNPNLQEESSDSYTIGGVFTPRFLPGFSLTADYFDITVNNVIVTLAAQTIVNGCYDSPGLSSPLCAGFTRNLGATNGPAGELPGQILNNGLVAGPQNFARRVRRGIDFEAAYRTNLGADIQLNTRLIYTHQFQNSNFENASLPDFENRILSELGDPQDEFRWNVDVTFGPLTVGYIMRYIGPQLTSTYENFFALPSACTTNTNPQVCPPLNTDAFDIYEYPAVTYHALRFDYRVRGNDDAERGGLNFYVGVDNLLDTEPPLGATGTGAGSAIYNIRGRNFYAGFRARF